MEDGDRHRRRPFIHPEVRRKRSPARFLASHISPVSSDPVRSMGPVKPSSRDMQLPWPMGAKISGGRGGPAPEGDGRSEEHTSELQSLMRNSYAVFCLKKKKHKQLEYSKKHTTHS